MLSSTLMTCVTPSRPEGAGVRVEVSNNGVEYFEGDVEYQYVESWSVTDLMRGTRW